MPVMQNYTINASASASYITYLRQITTFRIINRQFGEVLDKIPQFRQNSRFKNPPLFGISMATISVLNGPNLNMLGVREPGLYGHKTLTDIAAGLEKMANDLGHVLQFFQSNAEHEIVGRIHQAYHDQVDFIIINPAAFTHTSVAIRDALLATKIAFIEVHLSNVHAREPFRQHSYFSDIALGVICGLGARGYELAFQAAHQILHERTQNNGY